MNLKKMATFLGMSLGAFVFWKSRVHCRNDGPVYTRKQRADTILQGSYIVIRGKPCQVFQVQSVTIGSNNIRKFVAYDIFDRKEYEYQVLANVDCECPIVYDTMYEIINMSTEGRLILITNNGVLRDPLSLPPDLPPPHKPGGEDCNSLCEDDCGVDFVTRYRARLRAGQKVSAVVIRSMGREKVCGVVTSSRL